MSGSVRCADAWEVFLVLTDPENGMPQPRSILDISKKKQFQLDARHHRFIVAEKLRTAEMSDRIGVDVCLLNEPPDGHRENSVEIKGIQDMYQFMAVKEEPGYIFVRKNMCFCRFCVLYMYDDCLTGSRWERLNLKVELSKNVGYLNKIAKFYHGHDWDHFIDQKPPIVAFKNREDTQLAILKNKPFRCQEKMTIKSQKLKNDGKAYYFNIPKDSWCVVVDLLKEKENFYGHSILTIESSPAGSRVWIPISKLILPGPNSPELELYYGYFDFIKYEKKDYLTHNGRQLDTENYKIKRDVLVRIES